MLAEMSSPSSRSEQAKRHSLLQALHRRGMGSRLMLAKELNISNSRVCDLVDNMLGAGLLLEDGAMSTGERRGRRGVALRLNPSFGYLAGFDMEAKRLRLVITNFSGEVVWQTRRNLRPLSGRQALVDEILKFIDEGLNAAKEKFSPLLGIGLAASGVVDHKRGIILHYDFIPQATNLPLRDLISEHLGVPCVMENNIRAMTVAEWTGGAAKGLHSFVCVAVRSGVGAGVVINGKLISGSHGMCGEIGYMILPGAGAAAQWKNLQESVSESALGLDVEATGFDLPDATARRAGELIASQLCSIAVLLDPQAIILGGGMLDQTGPLWQHVNASFRKMALAELADRMPLIPATLGPFAAAIGAAHRCLYELFPVATVRH
jgi:predicted NBD/HSP70 family sugar kinase